VRVLLVPNTAASMVWFRLPFLRALRERGHRAWVVAPEDRGVDRILATGTGFLPLDHAHGWSLEPTDTRRSYFDALTDLRSVRDLARAMRVVRPDLVLAYTHKMSLLTPVAARLVGHPEVHGMVTGLGYANLGGSRRAELRREAYHAALAGAGALSRSLILLNRDNLDEVRRRALIPASKLYLMDGEGVDPEAWDAPAPSPSKGRLTFLMVARLVHHKGCATFVESAGRVRKHFPDARFILAGGHDPAHPDAIPTATLARWKREGVVELPGHLSDMRATYAGADVFVLPSDATEGLPMSIMEAMSMRRPILTTAEPGNRETVEEGVNGHLVPTGDDETLAARMMGLLQAPERVPAMGEASRARVLARFDHRIVNAGLLEHLGL
jgi:glycosyltransferase involved in cell wall biosynthesis